ncbi:putative uncharacterized protein ZNRD1-AS1 [Ochotona curzoniae]|uniref:putative uncharacterized protein ZNRD1-AS1 n=1 Tax=Ochotona curzoniae TaxID=130825 RepID=UPI001B34F017|nr:putative uncharacterized protein ZNRD1-AS1 [Ochotona curzoniae]
MKLHKKSKSTKPRVRGVSGNRAGRRTDTADKDRLVRHVPSEPISSLNQTPLQDSEWLTLSPQDKFAWAKASKDPRVAVGQQSPLEKKILNLGGVHTRAARQLIIQKHREEYEALRREQVLSFDYWLAKAESYYNKRIADMMKEEEADNGMKKETEESITESIEGQQCYYLVPERELKHMEKHIYQIGQARESRKKTVRQQLRPRDKIILPKIMLEEQGTQTTQRRKVSEREQMQIKNHQERMVRGRELLEQKLRERILRKSLSPLPIREKRKAVKKENKEFERVVAYPLFQPDSGSQIKVNILMETTPSREITSMIVQPAERKFLAVPPFLRSQIGKMKYW